MKEPMKGGAKAFGGDGAAEFCRAGSGTGYIAATDRSRAFRAFSMSWIVPGNLMLAHIDKHGGTIGKELLACSRKNSFDLPFYVEAVDIELGDFKVIQKYIKQARDIYDCETPP
jgi:hypothetical protein